MLYWRLFAGSVRFALHSLITNKLRTSLSLLGVTIGIFAIISVFTMVDSLEKKIRDSISALGDNVVFIQKWPWEFGKDYPWWKYFQRPLPTANEMEYIRLRSDKVKSAAFLASVRKPVSAGGNIVENTEIVMPTYQYDQVQNAEVGKGRYFTQTESDAGRPVAIIGSNIADNLYPGLNPLDKKIRILGRNYTVIGVFLRKGESMFGDSHDNKVVVPLKSATGVVDVKSDNTNPFIIVKAKDGISVDELKQELTGIMRALRKLRPAEEPDFALNEISLVNNSIREIFGIVNVAGWIIGLFSIIVGGFGIANIMFVSVKERTPVIGIQKSLGARNSFILFQFLAEAVILCFIGGMAGLALIGLGTLAINLVADAGIYLNASNVILGILISVTIGLIAGIIPAWIASRLDPVEAIRS